jgi:hypothetical protein
MLEEAGRQARDDYANWPRFYIPAIISCVESWGLAGWPEKPALETWPGSPRKASKAILDWLLSEITKLYVGNEDDDPNA